MEYRETQPPPSLARCIECFWTLAGDADIASTQPERILPDGCAELILNFGAHFCEQHPNGQQERQPSHFLVGQMTQPMLIAPTGRVQVLGVRFHPGGTLPFFPHPMHELTNRVVEFGALDSRLARELLALADDAPSLAEKTAVVARVLAARVRDCQPKTWLVGATAEIVRRGGQLSVDRLALDAGVSRRQLERRFLRDVGIGPKLLCRILRFQQVFRAVERNDAGWASVAADCGYYDQAHLIRDFQQFARTTPSTLLPQLDHLTEIFTRKNRPSHLSNTPPRITS